MRLDVKVEGIQELRNRFKDPALLREPLREMFDEAGTIGRQAMESGIDGGLGIAVKSINMSVQRDNAVVFSVLPKARGLSIEEGRKPGEEVPVLQIACWYKNTRHIRNFGGLTRSEIETIYTIQAGIRAAGTKGKHFLKKTRDAMMAAVPGLIEKMAQAVEERWRQRRGI